MAIRSRNIDLEVEGGKRVDTMYETVLSAVTTRMIWASPLAAQIEYIDFYPKNGVTAINVVARLGTDSDSTLGALTSLTSEARNRLTPSANNSLSVGTPIELLVSASTTPSATVIQVIYKPLTHRESR